MSFAELSRKDPPSPPHPPRPPPPSPTGKKYGSQRSIPLVDASESRPRSPPPAPPPSPSNVAMTETRRLQTVIESKAFPKLNELTNTLNAALDIPSAFPTRISYSYSEDDMPIPESPPPLEFTPPRKKSSGKLKRVLDDFQNEDLFGSHVTDAFQSKRRRTTIDLDDTIIFLPATHTHFFSALFSHQIDDVGYMHEELYRVHSELCA